MKAAPECDGSRYVLAAQCHARTYRLGRVQRAVGSYLATAPAGFGSYWWTSSGELGGHGAPVGVSIRQMVQHVYSTGSPTEPQIRAVQRAVRRLELLGLVDCWHAWTGRLEQRYTTARGFAGDIPVSALFVAARWHCDHERMGVAR